MCRTIRLLRKNGFAERSERRDDGYQRASRRCPPARRRDSARGNSALALWHGQQFEAHKRTLRELSRQSENLRTRFSITVE